MFYNHKTKKCTGTLGYVTEEEVARIKDLIRKGVRIGSVHPSPEEIAEFNESCASRDVDAEVARARQARLRRERGRMNES